MGAVKFTGDRYNVMIGHPRDTSAMIGFLERTGTGTISTTLKSPGIPYISPVGDEYIPNRTIAWGRRVNKKGIENISVSDPNYNGEIELLERGDEDGIPIELRYLETSPSLDYLYQLRIGLPAYNTEKSREYDYLSLKTGELSISLKTEKNKALFLRAHHLNADSPCKTTSYTGEGVSDVMRDVVDFDTAGKQASAADERHEAVTLVKSATKMSKLTLLNAIIKPTGLDYDTADPNSLFDALKIYADKNGADVNKKWQQYRTKVSSLIEKFKTFDALDFSKKGFVAIGQEPSRKVIAHSFPDMKKGDYSDYLFQNLLEDEVQEVITNMEIMDASLKG